MQENKFAQKLFKMQIGDMFSFKKRGEVEGTFIRVPSGWVYRYIFRGVSTSCFIPYTEDCRYWDMDLILSPCPFCFSTDVVLVDHTSGHSEIKCLSCGASSGIKKDRIDTIQSWNNIGR